MDEILKSKVSRSRFILRNPYAHIEYLAEPDSASQEIEATSAQIRASRKRLQNPVAYLDENGGFSAVLPAKRKPSTTNKQNTKRYSFAQIEAEANNLLRRMWLERHHLWDGNPPSDPADIIDPAIALKLIGYDFSFQEDLGEYSAGRKTIKVAGLIDKSSKTVHISNKFPYSERAFTAAHELGHAVLQHNTGDSIHRDRAVNGEKFSRNQLELEADKFASFFLMPEKLVRSRFIQLFGSDSITLNEDTAFALGCSIYEMQKKCRTTRDFSRMIAGASSYGIRYFPSLADQFQVSTLAMAIRLEELHLIEKLEK